MEVMCIFSPLALYTGSLAERGYVTIERLETSPSAAQVAVQKG
jgi:hypothetical protein